MKRFTYLLLLLSPFFVFSQKRLDLVYEKAFTFYDYPEKVFCALDDSTFIWKYNAKKEKWEKSPIELRIDLPFVKFLNDFVPMYEKGTPVYFVSAGCGVVYVKNGNTIKRHDHSFYHMNQYAGAYFMDEGEPRIYGGYGLFTNKNIITRYDTTEHEWYVVNTGIKTPPAGIRGLIKKSNNHYYVFDGFRGIGRNYSYQDRVWSLDLKTLKWKSIGRLNPKIQEKRREGFYELFQTIGNGYSCFENDIVSYDFEKMRYKKYKFNEPKLYKKIIRVDSLFLLCKMTSQYLRFIVISDSTFLEKFDCEEGEIILKESNSSISTLVIIFSFLTILFLFFVWQIKKRKTLRIKRKNKTENTLLIEADEFNQTELELLQLLFTHQESGLEISFINDLVNHDQPSIDTLKKRREILLKDLRYKLAAKFNIPQEEVFIERRMENDKRMKLLFLNELVKIKM
jgi:hypothetical protein